jgi:hypothetical protein
MTDPPREIDLLGEAYEVPEFDGVGRAEDFRSFPADPEESFAQQRNQWNLVRYVAKKNTDPAIPYEWIYVKEP